MTEAFVVSEDKEAVLNDGAADGEAELVALEGLGAAGEEGAGVEGVVAEEMEGRAVPLIGAAAAGDIDDAGGIAEFGLEEVALDLELLHGIERGGHRTIADARVAEFDAIEEVGGGTLALAADKQRAIRAAGSAADETGGPLRGRDLGHDARGERAEGEVITAVEREVVDRPASDSLAEGGGIEFEQGHSGAGDGDGFVNLADAEFEVGADALGDAKVDLLDNISLEAARGDGDAVAARRQLRKDILPARIRVGPAGGAGVDFGQGNRRLGYGGTAFVADQTGDG